MALFGSEARGDFGAFVDDGDFFARCAGGGGLVGDPLGIGDDAGGGLVAGASDAAFADRIADAAGDHEWEMLVSAREPSGGDSVGFVGMDAIEAAGA